MITTIGLVTGEEIDTQKWATEKRAIDDWGEGILRNNGALNIANPQPLLLEVRECGGKRQLVMINPAAVAWMRFG